MSQQYPSSHYQAAPYQTPCSAVSPPPMQVSYSTMQLQPSTRPQSPPPVPTSTDRYHTQYEINAHQSLEPPDINPQLSTNYSWQIVKKRKPTHPSPTLAARGLQSPFNSPNSFAELMHLQDDDNQAPASLPSTTPVSDPATQPRVHKPPPIYIYIYMALPTIVTWWNTSLEPWRTKNITVKLFLIKRYKSPLTHLTPIGDSSNDSKKTI